VKKFILSDLHIGYVESQYDAMDQAINYIYQEAGNEDQIWGLGDWFHITEMGLGCCMDHPMTRKFRDLAGHVTTMLIPGNHDRQLAKYRDDPTQVNPISPIQIIKPFWDNGFWYCHGHEYDLIAQHVGLPAFWDRLRRKKTPGDLRSGPLTLQFVTVASVIHARALLHLPTKAKEDGQDCKGIVLGHTHLPLVQEAPGLPYLLNDGDMRHSAAFVLKDDDGFHLLTWDYTGSKWLVTSSLRG
jgi:UDP-2,3-diacylglucosamine pyrophosphatase LpxH